MNIERLMLRVCVLLAGFALGCDRAPEAPAAVTASPTAQARLTPPESMQSTGHAHPSIVEWKTVDTFEQLLGASDLVVQATVVDRRFVNHRLYGYSQEKGRRLTAEEAGNEYTDMHLTESTVRIDRVARSSDRASSWKVGDTVVVSELGGQLGDGCVVAPDDKPLLETGDAVVLYLSAAGKPGVFHQIGGWQGRMYVKDGVVHPLAAKVHPQEAMLMRFDGLSVDALLTESAQRPGAPLPADELTGAGLAK